MTSHTSLLSSNRWHININFFSTLLAQHRMNEGEGMELFPSYPILTTYVIFLGPTRLESQSWKPQSWGLRHCCPYSVINPFEHWYTYIPLHAHILGSYCLPVLFCQQSSLPLAHRNVYTWKIPLDWWVRLFSITHQNPSYSSFQTAFWRTWFEYVT